MDTLSRKRGVLDAPIEAMRRRARSCDGRMLRGEFRMKK